MLKWLKLRFKIDKRFKKVTKGSTKNLHKINLTDLEELPANGSKKNKRDTRKL